MTIPDGMEGMLVLIINPRDPRLLSVSDPDSFKPEFGIVVRELGQSESGRYYETRCLVRCGGNTTEVLLLGRLVPLLRLPEHDALNLLPEEAVAKWAPEIIARHSIVSLLRPQQAFLFEARASRRRR